MNTENYRKTELSYAFLISRLYGGKAYREVKDANNLQSTKKYYLKIVSSILFTIEETIEIIDNDHKSTLLAEIDRFKKTIRASRAIHEIDQNMIAFQTTIIFLLLGQLPNRFHKEKVINKKDIWGLTSYRQIQYTQNLEQKKNLIFSAVQGKYKDRFADWGGFVSDIYYAQCKNEPALLVEWLKKIHPDIYLELF